MPGQQISQQLGSVPVAVVGPGAQLVQREDLDELRARAHAGDSDVSEQLADVLTKQGRGEEAEWLRRFGLNLDGSIARA